MTRAVVFAYHNVGVRCLSVLLAQRIAVPLVVTHRDDPRENVWFASIADLARSHEIPVVSPDDPNTEALVDEIRKTEPDFLFSFYYRHMLKPALLAVPRCGAFNMHGSLLPRYRGRVPINWAILNGETETGATLHAMTEKPDAGDIVDQMAVPILPDDTALDVFHKVTLAAELVLHRALPALVHGTARLAPQDHAAATYFGGRKPEDGRIDWRKSAREIHNLVRAVAPPYPGALTTLLGRPTRVLQTRVVSDTSWNDQAPRLFTDGGRILARCAGRGILRLIAVEIDGMLIAENVLAAQIGTDGTPLG